MAAAPGSGRASAPRLLALLLLLPLLWAPARVRAAPDEDSLRNKEPPAPAQQLQPQPVAAQGPEPPRAEVSRPGRAGRARRAGLRVPGSRPPAAGEGSLQPSSRGWEPAAGALFRGQAGAPPGSVCGGEGTEPSGIGGPGCC